MWRANVVVSSAGSSPLPPEPGDRRGIQVHGRRLTRVASSVRRVGLWPDLPVAHDLERRTRLEIHPHRVRFRPMDARWYRAGGAVEETTVALGCRNPLERVATDLDEPRVGRRESPSLHGDLPPARASRDGGRSPARATG